MNVRALCSPFAALALALGLCAAPGLAHADDPFKVVVSAPTAKVGEAAVAKVTITPAAGYHMNKDFPTSLKLTPTKGVEVPAKLAKSDGSVKVEEAAATFDVKYTASEKGPRTVVGQLSFAVCTATNCDPRKAPVTLNLDVK